MTRIVEASRSRRLGDLLHLALVGALAACGPSDGPPPEPQPDVDTLRASFIAQIESIDLVAGLETDGDEVRFVRPDGSGEDVEWRVRIDSLEVESGEGQGAQVLGRVRSAWSANGRPITVQQGPAGLVTDMPQWLLDAGLAPSECWALWDEEANAWGWT
ncbi:MAG: hypothetical protein F4X59_01405 [Holophagales bacterium]|nr:hypothetical protein [Holophagales bacterium]MXX61270.1 hypothetical protein [Holophagales bacterium]MYC08765.1 hypothetical protein [Holophagales bacterium]MYD22031.1 hypothetical protein [Holophagales bacterium]MYI34652.1 hypothetical protein [Holophagales bacterium]